MLQRGELAVRRDGQVFNQIKPVTRPSGGECPIEIKGEFPLRSNGFDGPEEANSGAELHSFAYRRRKEWAGALAFALSECHPDDAAQICAAFLEDHTTRGPQMGDPFGMVAGDAQLWADCALVHELAAYASAAMERLRGQAMATKARKRLFWALWGSFDRGDRSAFLSKVREGQQ